MSLSICSCGLSLVRRKNDTLWCRHCDEVCPIKPGRCSYCRELNKVEGLGAS